MIFKFVYSIRFQLLFFVFLFVSLLLECFDCLVLPRGLLYGCSDSALRVLSDFLLFVVPLGLLYERLYCFVHLDLIVRYALIYTNIVLLFSIIIYVDPIRLWPCINMTTFNFLIVSFWCSVSCFLGNSLLSLLRFLNPVFKTNKTLAFCVLLFFYFGLFMMCGQIPNKMN